MEQKMDLNATISDYKTITKQGKFYFAIKRLCDILFSLILLLLFFPLFVMTSFAIFVMGGNPIFFRQQRIGKHGRPFIIWKFRTMEVNESTDYATSYSWKNGVPDDFIFKAHPSANVTKIGLFLRKTSIDEIPQLINVLKGEMSLIGPRPEIPEIVKYYNGYQKKRLYVKPGITGYAQVNGRALINHGQKINYDLFYVENCSFLLDLKIIFLTFIRVLRADGAI